ncbi:hypothetical protein AV540_09730 [Brevibacillus parabrevis]|uniref:hypothetical protein n=1 Tax=Brevibacillus parabrevis TaxID=54914 RepID=UPI0007AC053E|nr:hypothetical protein [Brevibacillus parabrevis]KZE52883.1 hypothetical protein AV540_09730 [Brevibacillus parabrevis]
MGGLRFKKGRGFISWGGESSWLRGLIDVLPQAELFLTDGLTEQAKQQEEFQAFHEKRQR